MKAKLLIGLMCAMATMSANAAITYRTQQVIMPTPDSYGNDTESFARDHRFYVGGMYNLSMWNSYTDDRDVSVSGKNTSGFDAVAGVRLYDVFRLEANYIHTDAKYDAFKLKGDIAMINAIFDARIGSLYRILYHQHLVPYVGVGGGLAWYRSSDVDFDNKTTPVASIMAGLAIELGEYFAIDLGYRYMYMFSPKFDTISDMNPTANQFRAGVHLNF